jgi:hypothetical protein
VWASRSGWGAAPPAEELGSVWARVPTLSYDEGVRLVIGEIFATLNVRAMLPGMRAALVRRCPPRGPCTDSVTRLGPMRPWARCRTGGTATTVRWFT